VCNVQGDSFAVVPIINSNTEMGLGYRVYLGTVPVQYCNWITGRA